tara:strand:+ start:338 stop:622 length:285 start_codon:yes stop_codon:yes gene_type:complete
MENQSEIVARFEVEISLRDTRQAQVVWRDWIEHLSDDEVKTFMEGSDVFVFTSTNEDRWQDAEALARDFWRICRDNSWEADMSGVIAGVLSKNY